MATGESERRKDVKHEGNEQGEVGVRRPRVEEGEGTGAREEEEF